MDNYQIYITDLLSVIAKLIDSNSISGSDAVKMIRNIISLESVLDNINKDVTPQPSFIPCAQNPSTLGKIILSDFHSNLPDNSNSISVRPAEQPIVYTVNSTKEYEQHT